MQNSTFYCFFHSLSEKSERNSYILEPGKQREKVGVIRTSLWGQQRLLRWGTDLGGNSSALLAVLWLTV
jgi:hypothetical protein